MKAIAPRGNIKMEPEQKIAIIVIAIFVSHIHSAPIPIFYP